jgi:hypothetical protein
VASLYGPVTLRKVREQLAKGGFRLAAIINSMVPQ